MMLRKALRPLTFYFQLFALFVASSITAVAVTVTFDLDDKGTHAGGGELVQMIDSGTAAIAPTVSASAGWFFDSWDTDFSNVTTDITVKALYRPVFTVSFDLDGKGTRTGGGELIQEVVFGSPAIAPEVDADTGFVFGGWDHDFSSVTAHLLVTAKMLPAYTVTFDISPRGTLTSGELVQVVGEGRAATAPEFTVDTDWAFASWDTAFDSVAEDVTVMAVYESTILPTYTVTFDLDGKATHTGGGNLVQQIEEGGAAIEPGVEALPDFQFDGWDSDFDNITSDLTVTANYTPFYTVTFDLGVHGTLLAGSLTQKILEGEPAIQPVFAESDGWAFSGWDQGISRILEDTTLTAQYLPSKDTVVSGTEIFLSSLKNGYFAGGVGAHVAIDGDWAIASRGNNELKNYLDIFSRNEDGWEPVSQFRGPSNRDYISNFFGIPAKISGRTILTRTKNLINSGKYDIHLYDGPRQFPEDFDNDFGFSQSGWQCLDIDGDTLIFAVVPRFNSTNDFSGQVHIYERGVEEWSLAQIYDGDSTDSINSFGRAVAICNDTIIVTAWPNRASDPDLNIGGSAHILVRKTDGTWEEQAVLDADLDGVAHIFGGSAAISGDTAMVSAVWLDIETNTYNRGIYVFVRAGTFWARQAVITTKTDVSFANNSEPAFSLWGRKLVVSDDDETGNLYTKVFIQDGSVWRETAQLPRASKNLSISGNTVVLGFPKTMIFDPMYYWDPWFATGSVVFYDLAATNYRVRFDLSGRAYPTEGGELLQVIEPGGDAEAPMTNNLEGWLFTSWNSEFTNVTSDLVVEANFLRDIDEDTIPDDWERKYFANPFIANTETNSDSDEFSDGQEFVIGSDPTDGSDYFTITEQTFNGANSQLTVRFRSSDDHPQRRYRILTSSDLVQDSWQPLAGAEAIVPDSGDYTEFTITIPESDERRFFKLEAFMQN
ncbi:MAG: InlB B-repeat-containing protein [Verrucomicrobiota bacterium]